ncbi:hypothetical protein [Paractinoplanes ferrugineus]|uniref:Uncharacterized protein n=1 Tax=Paractinoplanes ferrugineus TaxID=113564 RepID=A0A919J8L1_9ACTN|nr:hypothetical protein [Actinoplanes ferrugineus]GIE15297.1 hypothetical protein Afe05nite_71370 [Actinoplanes ferrugineus]
MANQTNGHASPEELRKLAADWRAQAARLVSLGGTVMSAYKGIKWSGLAYLSATAAANAVNVKLKAMAESAGKFADFLDEYAGKVEEQIKKEKAAAIVQIVLAILGLLTMGLAVVLAPALAALSSLLASLLPAMSALASRIVTMVLDFALGFLTFGSMQVAMEFGTRGIVSAAMGLPLEVGSSELLNILLAGGLGGLFSIRGITAVPVRGSRGATPPPAPKMQAPPKASTATSPDGTGVQLNSPAPVKGADVAGAPRVSDGTPAVSASDLTAAPVLPTGSHTAPTASASSAGDARRLAAGSPGGAKSVSASAQQATGHVNQPLAAPHTNTTTSAPMGGARGDGPRTANLDRPGPTAGTRGDGSPQVHTPAANVTHQPGQPNVADRGPMSTTGGRGGTPEAPVTGPTMHATPSTGPATVPHGTSLPPAMRAGGLPETSALNAGSHLMPPPGRPGVAEHAATTGTPHTVAPSTPHGAGRMLDENATSAGHPNLQQLRDQRLSVIDPPRTSTGGGTHTVEPTNATAPPTTAAPQHTATPSTATPHAQPTAAPTAPRGPGRMLDENATSAGHPNLQQMRDQRLAAVDPPKTGTHSGGGPVRNQDLGGSPPRPGELDPPAAGHSDRSAATGIDSRLLDASAAPAPARAEAGGGRIEQGNVPLRPEATRADAPVPAATPRAGAPTPGRQLLQTGPDGRTDLVRVSAEPMFAGEGRRLGGDPHTVPGPGRPLAESAPERPATGPDKSFTYTELRADGTMGPTTLRPGENVMHSQPLAGKQTGVPAGGAHERILSYSADGRSWEVKPVAAAARPAAADPRPHQMLRQNPDGTVDLLTFEKPPALPSGPPAKPRPGEASFHDLDGPGASRGWQSRSIEPGERFTAEQVSRPQSTGQRLDGKELFFQREPTSLLVKDQATHHWTPLGTTEGVAAPPKGWGRAPDAAPVTVAKTPKPADGPAFTRDGTGPGTPPDNAHYRWNEANGAVEPVNVRATSIEVAEIGTQTRSVAIDRYTATGGKGGGSQLDSLRMLPDGTLAPANPRTITPDQIRYDSASGAITMDGTRPAGGHPSGGGGGHSGGGGGGGAPGSRGGGGLANRGPSRGSATQTDDGTLTFVKQPPRTAESSASTAPGSAAGTRDARTHAGQPGERPDPGRVLGSGKPATRPGAGIGGPGDAAAARAMTEVDHQVVLGTPADAPRNVLRKPRPEQPPATQEVRDTAPTGGQSTTQVSDTAPTGGQSTTEVGDSVSVGGRPPTEVRDDASVSGAPSVTAGVGAEDRTTAPAPAVPMRAPLPHEAPYVTAMPEGLAMTVQGNVVHLHAGAPPTRLVLRPGPDLTVVVDGSVTSLRLIHAALAELHPTRPVSLVEFVGDRRPVPPERAQRIAELLLTGLPGNPRISLLAAALTHPPAGAPAAPAYRFDPAGHVGPDIPAGAGNARPSGTDDFPAAPTHAPSPSGPADGMPDVPVEPELTRVRQLTRVIGFDAGLTPAEIDAVLAELDLRFGGAVLGPAGEGAARQLAVREIALRAGLDRDTTRLHADAVGVADVPAAEAALADFRSVIRQVGADNQLIAQVVDLAIARAESEGVPYTEATRAAMEQALRAGDEEAVAGLRAELDEARHNRAGYAAAHQRYLDQELAERLRALPPEITRPPGAGGSVAGDDASRPPSEQDHARATQVHDALAALPEAPHVGPVDPTFDQRLTSLPDLPATSPIAESELEDLVAVLAADARLDAEATAQVLAGLRREFGDAVFTPAVVGEARQAIARDVASRASADLARLEPLIARITGSDPDADAVALAEVSAELRRQGADRDLIERVADMRIGDAAQTGAGFAGARRDRLIQALADGDQAAYDGLVAEFEAVRQAREESTAAAELVLHKALEKRLAELKQFADELTTRTPVPPPVRDEPPAPTAQPDPAADAQRLLDLRAQLADLPPAPASTPRPAGDHSPADLAELLPDVPRPAPEPAEPLSAEAQRGADLEKLDGELRGRLADLIVGEHAGTGSRYTESERARLIDALRDGDAETLGQIRDRLETGAATHRRATEFEARRADEATDDRLTELGQAQPRRDFRSVLDELRTQRPVEPDSGLMMAPPRQRPTPPADPPGQFTEAATVEQELHRAGLDADSRFDAAVREWRDAHPEQADRLDAVLPAVRAEFENRTARSWRQLWATDGVGAGWPAELDRAAAELPHQLDAAVAGGVRTAPVQTSTGSTADGSVTTLADDIFRRSVGAVRYDRGLDVPAGHLETMRVAFRTSMQATQDRLGADADWDEYVAGQWTRLRADLVAADLAVAAAQDAARAFHRFLGDRAGPPGALDATMSAHAVRLLGVEFARDHLATHGRHVVELEALQQKAFEDAFTELRDPRNEITALSPAARAQRWAGRQEALRTDYAARIGTARRVEEFRPDLVRAFGNAVTDAAARTATTPPLRSLDGLPAEVTDQFRADFIAAGRDLFDQVWAPVIAAGARGYDAAFQAAEREWQVRYEHLLTGVRDHAFLYLQAHRHDPAVRAAMLQARDADRDVPESAYQAAAQAFYTDALAALRTAFDESADPARVDQWEALATTLEARIADYFTEEALRRHAAAPAERGGITPLLEATPTAYESAARPVLDQARADIDAALHRPGRDLDDATRLRITRELDARISEATTAARTRAERGGQTPAVVAAAVEALHGRLTELVRSVPVLVLHHALLGEQVRAAGPAFEELLTVELPVPVVEALGRSFTLDWLTAYDELFRGEQTSAAALTGLRELAATVRLTTPAQHLTDGALRTALLDAAATLPGDLVEVPSGILLRHSATGAAAGDLLAIASSFPPASGQQHVFVGPGVNLGRFLGEVTRTLREPDMRSRVVVHAPLTPPETLRGLADRLGVTVALTERPTDPALARRATPVDANGSPTLWQWAVQWHVRPMDAPPPAPFGLRQSPDGTYALPDGWVIEDLPWYAWARPAQVTDPALAARIRAGEFAGDTRFIVGEPGVAVPTAVATAGLDLLSRTPRVPGEQIPVRWFSDPELTTPAAAPHTRTAADEAAGTLTVTGHAEVRDALRTEPDPVRRDSLLTGLLGPGGAVLGALPVLHTALPVVTAPDAALARLLEYAHSAVRGEPLPVTEVHAAARGLRPETKAALIDGLRRLAVANPGRQTVLHTLGALILDC